MLLQPIQLKPTDQHLTFDPKDVVAAVPNKDFMLSAYGRQKLSGLAWVNASESALQGSDSLGVDSVTYASLAPYSGQPEPKGIIIRDRISKRLEWREVVSKSSGQLLLDEPWNFNFSPSISEYAVLPYGRDNTVDNLQCNLAWGQRTEAMIAENVPLSGGRAMFAFEKNLRVSGSIVCGASSFINLVHCRYSTVDVKAWRLPAGYGKESQDFGYAVTVSGASQHTAIRGYAKGCRHGANTGISSDPVEAYSGLVDYQVVDFVCEEGLDDCMRQHPVPISGATYLRCQANGIKRLYNDPGLSAGFQLEGGATLVDCSAKGYTSHPFSDGAGNATIRALGFKDLGKLQTA